MGLLELKVCNDRWPEMSLFAAIKKPKLDSWGLYFFQRASRNITKVQRERFGFENSLLMCFVGDAVVLDDLNGQFSSISWSSCKKLTLVW